jgi:hypothetical protein
MSRLLALAAFLLCSCNPQPQPGRTAAMPAPSQTGLPPLQITGEGTARRPIHVTQQKGNRKVYDLLAKSFVSRSARDVSHSQVVQPTITFFDKDGTKLVAQAPVATVEAGKQVTMAGGVHARTSTGVTLTCDRLTYDQPAEMLHGFGNVRISGNEGGARQTLTGSRFTSNVKLTNLVIR